MVVADIIAVASWGATGGTVEVQEGRAAETETCWSAGGTRRGGRRVQSAQDGALFDERGGQNKNEDPSGGEPEQRTAGGKRGA